MTETAASVSVVIPMFNSAATIERALESVAAQSLLPQEVIVVDDKSSDMSAGIVERWSNSTLAIKLIRHSQNLGPSASRNTGWDHATQKFIAFLDADDAWHPEKLRIQIQLMQRDPTIALIGHEYDIGVDTRWDDLSTIDFKMSTFSFSDFLIKNRLSTPTVMLRRELSQRFASDQRFSEDYRLWMEIVSEYGSASFINLPLTRLFKSSYGDSGLSSEMGSMYFGELHTFSCLRKKRLIKRPIMILCMLWSTIKYCRRRLRLSGTKN
ncbi:MAG: glycosyltransferase family 2 protein [Ilumatobacteraceae bacterium]